MKKAYIIKNIREQIENKLDKAKSALVKLYAEQTHIEKRTLMASTINRIGFNRPDAPIFSVLALKVIKHDELTPKEQGLLKTRIGKYASQLFRLALRDGIYMECRKGDFRITGEFTGTLV